MNNLINGLPVYPGKTVREFGFNVSTETTIPASIVLSGTGATQFVNPLTSAGSNGEVVVNNNTLNSDGRISWGYALNATLHEIAFFVNDWRFDVNGPTATKIQPYIALQTVGSQGVWFGHQADGSFASTIYNTANGGASETNSENYDFANTGIGQGRKNIGIIIRPQEKTAYLVDGTDNGVVVARSPILLTNFPSGGVITPMFGFKNVDGAAHWMRFTGVKVRVVTG